MNEDKELSASERWIQALQSLMLLLYCVEDGVARAFMCEWRCVGVGGDASR